METALGNTAPVGSYPKGVSPYGVHDMAGNVWEWTTDWLLPYPRHELEGKEIVGAEFKVVRGGSRNDGELQTRCSARSGFRPDEGNSTNGGFRCALSAE
jgi:formylglycine-generating enzyme required for sulfatase activity